MPKLNDMPAIYEQLSGEVKDNVVELYDCHGYEPTKRDLLAWYHNDQAILENNGFSIDTGKNEPPGRCQEAYYRIIVKE